MTDRTNHLTVVLDQDYREDDVESIIKAIGMIKGVISVGVNVTDSRDYVARANARAELTSKLWDVLNPRG
jgi:hypothetical protein